MGLSKREPFLDIPGVNETPQGGDLSDILVPKQSLRR